MDTQKRCASPSWRTWPPPSVERQRPITNSARKHAHVAVSGSRPCCSRACDPASARPHRLPRRRIRRRARGPGKAEAARIRGAASDGGIRRKKPTSTVAMPFTTMVTRKVYLRPTRSPMRPRSAPRTGGRGSRRVSAERSEQGGVWLPTERQRGKKRGEDRVQIKVVPFENIPTDER